MLEVRDPADVRTVVAEVPAMTASEVAAAYTRARVEPVGVVLAICPWNDPLITPARKLGPALIAGNAVLLKAASQTPLIAMWLAGLLTEAGLPAGVFQVITGRNSEISAALLAEPDAVTFTGSNEAGGYLRRQLAGRNVRLQAELGGKNVSVVLEQGSPGLRFYTRVKTAAVRFAW